MSKVKLEMAYATIAKMEIELKALRTPKCQQIQPDEAAMLNNGDYCAEELFGAGGVKTCPGCEHCNINKMFEWVTIDSCQSHGTIQGVGHAFPHKYKPSNYDAGEVERLKVEHAVNSKIYCGATENHKFGDSYTCGENPYGDKNGKLHHCAQCAGSEVRRESQLFEVAYRAQARSPVFIVNDMLVKDADGDYFHLATRTAFKFFKLGRESWTN